MILYPLIYLRWLYLTLLWRQDQHRKALHQAGFEFIADNLRAGVNPVALLMAIERQAKLTDYDLGAIAALQINHVVVRALLKRYYG